MAKYEGKGATGGGSSGPVRAHLEIQRFPASRRFKGSSSVRVQVYSDFTWGKCQRWRAEHPANSV